MKTSLASSSKDSARQRIADSTMMRSLSWSFMGSAAIVGELVVWDAIARERKHVLWPFSFWLTCAYDCFISEKGKLW